MRPHPILARVTTAAVLLALSLASPVAAGPGPGKAGAAATTIQAPSVRIDNFGRVSETYYRGAQPVGQDYVDLASLGVKTVINLTSDDASPEEPSMVEQAGMRYLAIPMNTRVAPTAEQLDQFLEVVNDPANQPVYVHCVGGKHRTGVMTAVYRMAEHAWTPERAFGEMKQYRFGADFLHPEFKKFVYGYRVPTAAKTPADTLVDSDAGSPRVTPVSSTR